MSYRPRHEAPTNQRCTFTLTLDEGETVRCLRYNGHPRDLYGRLGHRMKRRPREYVYVCTRDMLAGAAGRKLQQRPRGSA
jgi:hypothetical protein